MFFSPDGKRILISTASANLPGPVLALNCTYPKTPTGQKYIVNNCQHEFHHKEFRQIRSGDEAPNSILECSKCKITKIV
nr:lef-5 [Oryctes rhinoceros nudivirus]